MICPQNLQKMNKYSQEDVAARLHVSRQAIAKWENGETTPDINHCAALATLYNVTIDELICHKESVSGLPIPPKGKHFFGNVTLNEKGQIVIPKKARQIFDLKPGDELSLLGDENQGLALLKTEDMLKLLEQINASVWRES